MVNIGERIKDIRKSKKMTQQALADAIGLKRNTIANYEIGNIVPSDRTISDICRVFGVSETWLRTGEGEMLVPVTRDEQIAAFMGDLLSGTPDFRCRLIAVLARLSKEEWKMLEKIANMLLEEEKAGQ
jgi:transcriptional regulator with XRE-family HTH domain